MESEGYFVENNPDDKWSERWAWRRGLSYTLIVATLVMGAFWVGMKWKEPTGDNVMVLATEKYKEVPGLVARYDDAYGLYWNAGEQWLPLVKEDDPHLMRKVLEAMKGKRVRIEVTGAEVGR